MHLSASLGSKNLKIGVQNGLKLKRRSSTQEWPSWSVDLHFSSVDWHKSEAWHEEFWIEINLTFFDFLEIRTRPNSYYDHSANFSKHSHPYK